MLQFQQLLPQLPNTARVWLFGASRTLNAEECESLESSISSFVAHWQAHGKDLVAGYALLWRGILVVAVDESKEPPSGCSIDKVFHLLKTQQEKTGLDFLQRTLIWMPETAELRIHTLETLIEAIDNGTCEQDSLTVNMMATTLGELRTNGLIPLSKSWVTKKLQKATKQP
jgi:hypothetical protein